MKLTVQEAAKYAGVSPAMIYLWTEERRLPQYRLGGEGKRGKILIDPRDLDTFIERCRVGAHPLLDELPCPPRP
jgi:excisionase family DNA binding protein